MTKPFIGISGNILRDNGGPYVDLLRSYVNQDYPRSIEETGGIPIIIPFTENLDVARETVARLDGLLLSGGHDVYPLHYGEEPLQGLGDVFPERDQFDFALIKAYKGDRWGNLVYRKSARNFGPIMAMAAAVSIAQVQEVVELGALDPEHIVTPGIFVQHVVQI